MSTNSTNPANDKKVFEIPKGYRPMSNATLSLEVPSRDGYHRHWFRGTPERIGRAQQAGYAFVDKDEIGDSVNNFDLAGDSDASGSTDLGDRVSVLSGDDITNNGQPGRLYLMECPMDLYEHSKSILQEMNDDVASAIRGGNIGKGESADPAQRYMKGKPPALFTPNQRRT